MKENDNDRTAIVRERGGNTGASPAMPQVSGERLRRAKHLDRIRTSMPLLPAGMAVRPNGKGSGEGAHRRRPTFAAGQDRLDAQHAHRGRSTQKQRVIASRST